LLLFFVLLEELFLLEALPALEALLLFFEEL
jgi:hypothetical protein